MKIPVVFDRLWQNRVNTPGLATAGLPSAYVKKPSSSEVERGGCEIAGAHRTALSERLGEIAEELEGRADELDRADPRSANSG